MEEFNSPQLFLVWLLGISFIQIYVQAHSIASKPLTYLEFVGNPIIERLPRDRFEIHNAHRDPVKDSPSLRHDDSMRVQFVAFNQTFNLHLEPNLELYHAEAKITYHHSNNTSSTIRLLPEDHRLYKGIVLGIDSTEKRLVEDIIGLKRHSLFEELAYSPGVLGWARIHVLDDGNLSEYGTNTRHPTFEGTFSYENDLYHIKSIENFHSIQYPEDPEIPNPSARHQSHRFATMVIYRDSDIKHSNLSKRANTLTDRQVQGCAMDDLPFNVDLNNDYRKMRKEWAFQYNQGQISTNEEDSLWNLNFAGFRFSRASNESTKLTKRQTAAGCPTARKINYMGAAADCTYVKKYGSQDAARKQILSDWNTASAVYESTFNVTLGLISLDIRDGTCPSQLDQTSLWNRECADSYSINNRLSDFSSWRGTKGDDGTGLWHLLTTCSTGTKVGVAWLGQLCETKVTQQNTEYGLASVANTGVSSASKDEWKVVAHEVGHGFGAIHDCMSFDCPCTDCQCCPLSSSTCDANAQYIMNPTSNSVSNSFSPCSINDICSAYPNLGTCLGDPGNKKILSEAMCGNGIKEDGEECDCGTETECANDPCCNGSTCKFKAGAICDDRNDLCCKNCTIRAAGTVCRPAISSCDLAEVCNGTSAMCPTDAHVSDGSSCGGNGLACAGGQCTSRDAQCAARGSRSGITKSCKISSDGCTITCANPGDSRSCLELSGSFVDGTPCGYGGKCSKGSCQSGSFGNTVSSWIDQNKKIIIPVAAVLGLMILCSIIQCCCGCFKRRGKPSRQRVLSQERVNPAYNISGAYSVPASSPTRQYSTNWVDPTPYNGLTPNQQSFHSPPTTAPPTTAPPYSPQQAFAGAGV
ncbi:7004_t:CDS:10 [Ambispora gerdemannii]|uniref:7004_t:CDS:1 n=1 Tax=Ambispora gerdemannii TaxID=144530 RepID=A0A9N8ZZL9_9GLOM|nr:7004_t:CDS:10 [Ambispora gerdemannii]